MDVREASFPWYVLQTKPHGFEVVRTHLERQGYDSFMPLQQVTRKTRRGMRQVLRPLFPGYIFFSGLNSEINWREVKYTRGVRSILTSRGGMPARLPQDVMEELLQMTDERGLLKEITEFVPGDRVQIVNGPMSGSFANVLALSDTERVNVLLDIMGRSVSVHVARRDLEPSSATRS